MNQNSRFWAKPPTAILAVLAGMTALSIDICLPAMGELQEFFQTTNQHLNVAKVQFVISAFLIGYALGQLVCGPISDKKGRRPVLLVGLLLFTIAGFCCTFSQTLEQLIFFRFVQGLSGSVGPALSRAIVRDKYGRQEAAAVLSQITQAMILAPVLAPIFGSLILENIGWREVFGALAFIGVWLVLICGLKLPETMAHKEEGAVAGRTIHNFRTVLAHRGSLPFILVAGVSYSGLFAYIIGSSPVFLKGFHLKPGPYSWYFALIAFSLMVGASLNRKLLPTLGPAKIMQRGSWVLFFSGASLAVLAWTYPTVLGVVIPMMGFLFGLGLVTPNSIALAMEPHGRLAGVVSSVIGFIQTIGGVITGQMIGHYFDNSPKSLAAAMAFLGTATLLIVSVTKKHPAHPQ